MRSMAMTGLLSTRFPMVVVGEKSGKMADLAEFADAVAQKRIIMLEGLTEGELRWLYENCRLFLSLCLDEGFGLPTVEAANFGAPIIASDIPVFHETLGQFGTFVNPTNTDEIAAAARNAICGPRCNSKMYTEKHSWNTVCQAIRSQLVILSNRAEETTPPPLPASSSSETGCARNGQTADEFGSE